MTRLMDWRGHLYLGLAARWYIGIVFLMACIHKIAVPYAFAVDVATYQFLPLPLINLFALVLPWVELVAGALILIGWRTRASALLIALMMAAFMIGLGHALALDLDMSCGCFASSAAEEGDSISMMTMLRDAAWLTIALYILVFDRNPLGVDGWLARRRTP